ncbi:MAG: UDP-N-acetylmuramate dehydrogenase [Bacteroidetes bacterium]|nr:UDP-N-acetylmuramate dehydrogenase [Bacteroidota bacterium]
MVANECYGSDTKRSLEDRIGHQTVVKEGIVLAPYTTIKVGGPADFFVEVNSADSLQSAVLAARKLEIPYFLLGCGANIIIGDAGFRGLVIRNMANHISIDQHLVTAESGAIMFPDLIELTASHSLSGLEHYVGIPSTVGGALWQNLHFLSPAPLRERTMFIEEVLEFADLLTEENEYKRVGIDYFEFGYDQSILHHRDDIVLRACFRLETKLQTSIHTVMKENLEWRALRHPDLHTEPSVGSIFKKIEGIGAGRLIDECDLKGASIGGMVVTHRHANIIVNQGHGTAADLQSLITYIQEQVAHQTGYHLETEIECVGEFDPPTQGDPVFLERPEGLVTAEELAMR